MATARKKVAKKPPRKRPATRSKAVKAAPKPARRKQVAQVAPSKPAATPGFARSAAKRLSRGALQLAGVGSDAVARATGRAWDQWLTLLDKAGAMAMPHKAIANLLAERWGVPPWWSQMVAVGYEQARGLRQPGQLADGYAANASRTMGVALERLYGAWADPALRSLWMGPAPVKVERARDGKSMRMTWTAGGSDVEVHFTPQGAGKSRVAVQHRKLEDPEAIAQKKGFWTGALARLKLLLEKAA